MGPILVFGAVGVLGLLAAAKGKASTSQGAGSLSTTPPPGEGALGDPVLATGTSGKQWKVQRVSSQGGISEFDVYATAGSFGPHQEFRVLRYSQTGNDGNSRQFVSSAAGIDPSIIHAAIVDFGIHQPGVVKSSLVQSQQQGPVMSDALKQALANAMKLLTIGPSGEVIGPVLPDAIRIATETAGRLDASGFPEAGSALREYIKRAAAHVPSPPPEKRVPLPPSIPSSIQEQINRAIDMERDPQKLRALVAGLKKLPASPERDAAIAMLEAIIVQAEAKRQTDATLEEVDKVIKSPGIPQSTTPVPPPLPPPPAAPPITAMPQSVPVPTVPVPQPAPTEKTPVQRAAADMVLNLKNVQARFGVKGSKGKEDTSLVKRLQSLSNGVLTVDGKTGPSVLVFAAKDGGVSNLPMVMYWPHSSTKDKVLQYRGILMNLAELRRREGNLTAAAELEASAARERGEGGIVGTMPA